MEKRTAVIIDPFRDAEEVVWLGGGSGTIRKVYRVVNTKYFHVGLVVSTPGEGGSVHVHPSTEEFSYVIQGGGTQLGENDEPIGYARQGDIKWNPAGSYHGGKNDTDGVNIKIWCYSSGGELPTNDGVFQEKTGAENK
jgi:quercetin dioxygenase-like cupin family protein